MIRLAKIRALPEARTRDSRVRFAVLVALLAIGASCAGVKPSGTPSAADAAAETGAAPPGSINTDGGNAGVSADGGLASDANLPSAPSNGPWSGQRIDPSAPPTSPMMFSGQGVTAGGPRVVYPLDGAMHPANILSLAIHWQGLSPPQGRLYRLRLTNARGMMDFYTTCAVDECIYKVTPDTWQIVGNANRDSDVSLTVAAAGNGVTVPISPAIQIHFTPTSVAGGLYYWSTAKAGIYRLTFGQSKAVPFIDDAASCHGCHTVSRNGKQIAWVDYGSIGPFRGPGMTSIRSAPTDAPPPAAPKSRIDGGSVALNPDGTRFLVSTGTSLALYDAVTLAAVSTMTPASLGTKSMMFLESARSVSQHHRHSIAESDEQRRSISQAHARCGRAFSRRVG